mgnify:CR=1 FL=1
MANRLISKGWRWMVNSLLIFLLILLLLAAGILFVFAAVAIKIAAYYQLGTE